MIPLSTTTITIRRPVSSDPYEDSGEDDEIVATGINAHISTDNGSELSVGGQQSTTEFALVCDPCDLIHTDLVIDETTDTPYQVQWVSNRYQMGLEHMRVQLRLVVGATSG